MATPLASAGVASTAGASAQLLSFMRVFEVIFHPLWFAAMTGLMLVVYEWYRNSGEGSELAKRMVALPGIIAVGTTPALGYVLYSPAPIRKALTDPPWQVDVASAVGVVVTASLVYLVWRHFEWGDLAPGDAVVIIATLFPYVLIAPFWNISGHVTFTSIQALYLTYVDRRFAPLMLVPLITLVNRPLLGAHTWLQSISGFLLALLVLSVVVVSVLDDVGSGSPVGGRPLGDDK